MEISNVPPAPQQGCLSRRSLLLAGSVACFLPSAWAAQADRVTLLAAWQDGAEQHIGLLGIGDTSWSVRRALAVPTRAHGLWAEAEGTMLAVARRPGDWLLRWHPAQGRTQWHWIGEDRRFNGHVIASADGATIWTTETDLDTAQGRIGMRAADSLEKVGEWATHGMDPHQLLTLPQAVGDLPSGTLMVANGGIPTLPETGRSKRELGRMDASLVALHPGTGALLGQWRLRDPYLSMRHLAFDPSSGTLGIALQAEHPDRGARAAAPVLAVWNGLALRVAEDQPPLAGYGGDLVALPAGDDGGFAVSCPRAHALALFDPQARWRGARAHPEACALAVAGRRWWLAGGSGRVALHRGHDNEVVGPPLSGTGKITQFNIDNHWAWVAG